MSNGLLRTTRINFTTSPPFPKLLKEENRIPDDSVFKGLSITDISIVEMDYTRRSIQFPFAIAHFNKAVLKAPFEGVEPGTAEAKFLIANWLLDEEKIEDPFQVYGLAFRLRYEPKTTELSGTVHPLSKGHGRLLSLKLGLVLRYDEIVPH